jgi:GT2 family glycosyltransferase
MSEIEHRAEAALATTGVLHAASTPAVDSQLASVCTAGKFVYAGDKKLYLRGVTYGTFRGPDDQLPQPNVVAADFAAMAANGVNTIRTYTVPPPWLLDLAAERGLRILVGIAWQQHIAFLNERSSRRAILQSVRSGVRACADHPAVLGYLIGNEIPAGIVRWHGRQRMEGFIERLYREAKTEDPSALVTYANYPSTEYLHLPFLDILCFNVFLEDQTTFDHYVARLQTIAGDRPLVITEVGLDSRSHGVAAQAQTIDSQLRAAFAGGCAGCFVFAWTDEWNRAGYEVNDWDFGLVDRAREPKPALQAVRSSFQSGPFSDDLRWPKVSVVVCTYNGARTIEGCLDALLGLDYPDFDVIVVDDGSSDGVSALAASYDVRMIRTEHRGLSAARNTGTDASDGEIVAFCDDDCLPDADWLRYLVRSLTGSTHAGVGGPNVPPSDTLIADSIGHAPGGPVHVLASDSVAKHIPGCNMAFHRAVLEQVGGFDPRFRVAGDDVDVCWRIQDAGGTLGFSPAALVWHRARSSVAAYVRQQVGYGRAEALLERKWPERYNGNGHVDWTGVVYGGKDCRSFARRRWRVHYGIFGSGLFQSVYHGPPSFQSAFPMAPEWYLFTFVLAAAALCGLIGPPLPFAVPVLGASLSLVLVMVCLFAIAAQASMWTAAVILPGSTSFVRRLGIRSVVFALCLLQPLARLCGRTHRGLTPWRRRGPWSLAFPRPRSVGVWSEQWAPAEEWVERFEADLRRARLQLVRGGEFDTWDLQARIGPLAAGRLRLAVEEHGQGKQLVRVRMWPRVASRAAIIDGLLVLTAVSAAARGAVLAAAAFGLGALWLIVGIISQAAAAVVLPTRAAARLTDRGHAPTARSVLSRQPWANVAPNLYRQRPEPTGEEE